MIKLRPNQEVKARSPLKDAPLRHPGQSIQAEIAKTADQYDSYLVVIVVSLVMAFNAWVQLLMGTPPLTMTLVTTTMALGIIAYAAPKMLRAVAKVRLLKQARDGERAVAECLDLLREDGCRVLHDIVGDGFNVDHVVISPQGVFTVETKTISKPSNGDAKVHYDGEKIKIGRYQPSRDPVVQAKAQASWLKGLLKASTGKDFPVRPVVVFPGWYVERSHKDRGKDLWVLEPKAFQGFLKHEDMLISKEDVALATYHLKRYIRATPPFA